MEDTSRRLTYKSQFGDYGLTADHNIHVLYDNLGAYEDLGTIEYLTNCVARIKDMEEKNGRRKIEHLSEDRQD